MSYALEHYKPEGREGFHDWLEEKLKKDHGERKGMHYYWHYRGANFNFTQTEAYLSLLRK